MIHPCQAKCAWCSTHLKNPRFHALHRNGEADDFHEFYLKVAKRYRPAEVFVSGGEPLLYPGIAEFLTKLAEYTDKIHIFTSYQFNRKVIQDFGTKAIPWEKIVLNHTPIYFEPDNWDKLTGGFPFETYLANIKDTVQLPATKRFKFIINHSGFVDEIKRFQERIEPDKSCEISLKMMNDQGDGLGVAVMEKTAERVRNRLDDLDGVLKLAGWSNQPRPTTSADLMKPVIETGDVTKCVYRKDPLELRLAFYRGDPGGKKILKYRYCPYFPPDFGHKFHLGRDDIEKLGKNYKTGSFRDHCEKCRMKHYCPASAAK